MKSYDNIRAGIYIIDILSGLIHSHYKLYVNVINECLF